MIPDIGQYALVLALCLALVQACVPLLGARTGNASWMDLARPVAIGQVLFVFLAYLALTYAFVTNDFSVAYVAENSNLKLPLVYRIAGVWGAHEGSLLLWVTILGVWTLAAALFNRRLPRQISSSVIAVMGMISIGFLLFILTTSNPFTQQFPVPANGRDLNPLLQDPGMASHPPMLYMGYVGFSVAFAFAIAALLSGRLDAAWARWTRPWTTAAWLFLTAGITLGSWWSYRVLGWGGWWFWDPVENASFMPWLVGTALIHSLAVTEKRGAFKSWTALLAICAFSLSLLGTFLVRSGVLVSVHAFAESPSRGIYILSFLGVVVGSSFLLYAFRAPRLQSDVAINWISREGLLLLNNLFLVVAAAAVLLGTLYPLIAGALGLGKLSVGPPYFDTVFLPLTIPLVLLVGFAMSLRWRAGRLRDSLQRLRLPAAAAVVVALVFPWLLLGRFAVVAVPALLLAFWAIFATLQEPVRRFRQHRAGWSGLRRMPRGVWGMTLAHLGLGIFVIGVTLVTTFRSERDVSLHPGDSARIAPYTFTFRGTRKVDGPNYSEDQGTVYVERNGHPAALIHPAKRHYDNGTSAPITHAGINWRPTRDLYVSLGERATDGGWSMRLYYKPFVSWIWFGGLFMAVGGLLAATDRRYRLSVRQQRRASGKARLSALPATGE